MTYEEFEDLKQNCLEKGICMHCSKVPALMSDFELREYRNSAICINCWNELVKD